MLLRRIQRFDLPFLRYRFPRWTFYKSLALKLDRVQRRMILIVLATKLIEGEDLSVFYRRRAKLATAEQKSQRAWSEVWAGCVVSWGAHVLRNSGNAFFVAQLNGVMGSSELSQRRSLNSCRPCTRTSPGIIVRRWWDGVDNSQLFVNSLQTQH